MPRHRPKRALIIAGPNGAGKTTFALQFLPREAEMLDFVNADSIAAGLSPLDPDRAAVEAGRLMIRAIRNHVLPFVELVESRVAERVRLGGHDVPTSVIRRRFIAGRDNFERFYKSLVDEWWLFDNSARAIRIMAHGGTS